MRCGKNPEDFREEAEVAAQQEEAWLRGWRPACGVTRRDGDGTLSPPAAVSSGGHLLPKLEKTNLLLPGTMYLLQEWIMYKVINSVYS
uniref:Uncharacterized protein n=1 Tax=Oryza punctata TaxID=4537 RepID=A0A0E0KFZ0_ORYPU